MRLSPAVRTTSAVCDAKFARTRTSAGSTVTRSGVLPVPPVLPLAVDSLSQRDAVLAVHCWTGTCGSSTVRLPASWAGVVPAVTVNRVSPVRRQAGVPTVRLTGTGTGLVRGPDLSTSSAS